MKFYYEGTLIRTSKTHHYTHAVLTPAGKTFACSSSREGAEKALQSRISWWGSEVFNCKNAIKAIEAGRKTYTAKDGRRTYTERVTNSLEYYQKQLNTVEGIINGLRNYRIVELEARS